MRGRLFSGFVLASRLWSLTSWTDGRTDIPLWNASRDLTIPHSSVMREPTCHMDGDLADYACTALQPSRLLWGPFPAIRSHASCTRVTTNTRQTSTFPGRRLGHGASLQESGPQLGGGRNLCPNSRMRVSKCHRGGWKVVTGTWAPRANNACFVRKISLEGEARS